MKNDIKIISVISILLMITLVSAANFDASVNPTDADEDTETLFNFTVTNTDPLENITGIKISSSDGLYFIKGTEGTSASDIGFGFVRPDRIGGPNDTIVGFIESGATETFWAEASAALPGDYIFTVNCDGTNSSWIETNIQVTINDVGTITNFQVIPNTSISENNPMNMSADVNDVNLGSVAVVIVDPNNMTNTNQTLLIIHMDESGVSGSYGIIDYPAIYFNIADGTISESVTAFIPDMPPTEFFVFGYFYKNETEPVQSDCMLAFGMDDYSLLGGNCEGSGDIHSQIESGMSKFKVSSMKFTKGLHDQPYEVNGSSFKLYDITTSNELNPHLEEMTLPSGEYLVILRAEDDVHNELDFEMLDIVIDNDVPIIHSVSLQPNPVHIGDIVTIDVNVSDNNEVDIVTAIIDNNTIDLSKVGNDLWQANFVVPDPNEYTVTIVAIDSAKLKTKTEKNLTVSPVVEMPAVEEEPVQPVPLVMPSRPPTFTDGYPPEKETIEEIIVEQPEEIIDEIIEEETVSGPTGMILGETEATYLGAGVAGVIGLAGVFYYFKVFKPKPKLKKIKKKR